jgi:TolB-like protein/Tfp pilus assembly protein PilF
MTSLIEGYTYDVFISYRHNDNRSGWVTDFVQHLQSELAATIKDPVSVYFDTNPHDGLLETHSVDKTLEGKLKCLIFIPILSQTYCDPKSFAWQHEFVAFNRLAGEDGLGREVKLANGNIASRILPVRIHELDAQDKATIEKELGSVLRAIDFTFRSAGVNRPLGHHEEHGSENLNKTNYKDQVNKLANAIKELLHGLKKKAGGDVSSRAETPLVFEATVKVGTKKKISIWALSVLAVFMLALVAFYVAVPKTITGKKSIAVLPFKNLSKDPDQEYFTQGITEDILNHLSKIADLQVKASYSSFGYSGSAKPIAEIGEELNVATILTGSIQRDGKNVRVIAQLIDVQTNEQIWSEKYDRRVDDVLKLQSDIAGEIVRYLKAKLSSEETISIQRPVSKSIEAYEYYLKARMILQAGELQRASFKPVLSLLNKSIALDPSFSDAYALKGWAWRFSNRFGYAPSLWMDSSLYFASKAIEYDPSNPSGYFLRSQINNYKPVTYGDASDLEKAYTLAPNNTDILFGLGFAYLRNNNAEGAQLLAKAGELRYTDGEPDYYRFWSGMYDAAGEFEKAEAMLDRVEQLDPSAPSTAIPRAYMKVHSRDYKQAIALAKDATRKLVATGADPVELVRPYEILAESYAQLGEIDSSLHWFAKFHEIEKIFPDSSQHLSVVHREAHMFWMKGDKKRAMKLFRQQQHNDSLRITGQGAGGWADITSNYYDLAVVHAFLGEDEAAYKCFEKMRLGGVEPWLFLYLESDLLLKDFRKKPRFIEFFEVMKRDHQLKVDALRKAINLHEASEEMKKVSGR